MIIRATEKLKRLLRWAAENNISDKDSIQSLTVGDLRELVVADGKPTEGYTSEGSRVMIEAAAIEFTVGGNTLWVQSPVGATLLRIKTKGSISIERCQTSPVSHADMIVEDDIRICCSDDAEEVP